MQDALRGLLVLLQAAEAFRNGPANGTRMRKPMKCLEITPSPIIPISFSWTSRNAERALANLMQREAHSAWPE
jgi:hypothetical protein